MLSLTFFFFFFSVYYKQSLFPNLVRRASEKKPARKIKRHSFRAAPISIVCFACVTDLAGKEGLRYILYSSGYEFFYVTGTGNHNISYA